MGNFSVEHDSIEQNNEDANTKRIKEIIVELLLIQTAAFVKEKEDQLNKYESDLLKTVGRNYYLHPSEYHGGLDIRERFWAKSIIEKVENDKHFKKLMQYKCIAILINAIREGRQEFLDTDLPDQIFNDPAELHLLREHFTWHLRSRDHNSAAVVVFDKLVKHASQHLNSNFKTVRSDNGHQKYKQLVELFQNIRNIDDTDDKERLIKMANLIKAELDANPQEENLIFNRGGFFGAYKTYSKCLNKLGFLHYKYNGRTAISTTDHLLIELLDSIQDELKYLGVQEDDIKEPRVVIID